MNILVLCTGNSARSMPFEGILAGLGCRAHATGSTPVGCVNPVALERFARHGITLNAPRSKAWDAFAADDASRPNLVTTVYGNPAGETCPVWPPTDDHTSLRSHWAVEDPDEPAACETAFQILNRRAQAFHALADRRDVAAFARIGTRP